MTAHLSPSQHRPPSLRNQRRWSSAFLLALALVVYVSTAHAQPSSRGTTETLVSLHSKALDRTVSYVAITPSPLIPGKRYPVLYLLHGATGGHRDWTRQTSVTALLARRDMIVINPDGGPYGWYLDSPCRDNSRYRTHIVEEVVRDVDQRFPTITSRLGRGIAGLSMGGHGALSLAALHPETFGSASSMSGILRLQNHPKSWQLDQLLGELPAAEDEWCRHSVFSLAERYTTAGVALLFDTGTSDTLSVEDCRQVHRKLTELGVDHTYREFPGGHTWDYWRERLPEHLDFHGHAFSQRKGQ